LVVTNINTLSSDNNKLFKENLIKSKINDLHSRIDIVFNLIESYREKTKQENIKKTVEENLMTHSHQLYSIITKYYIDHKDNMPDEQLKNNINYFLQTQPQVSLEHIIKKFPITKGIAELISYISIAKNSQNTHIDTTKHIKLTIKDSDENIKVVSVPNIIFTKDKS
jgi:hypothetical protein